MKGKDKLVIFDFSGTISNALPDIVEVIKTLSEKYSLAMVSNAESGSLKNYLARFDLHEEFSEIIGYDSPGDKTEKIKELVLKFDLDPKNAIYITDLVDDILSAYAAGVKAIGVAWGLEKVEQFNQIPKLSVAESPADLPRLVEETFK